MKKRVAVLYLLLLMFMSACSPYGTIYGVAVDERKATTIAADKKITATIQKNFLEDNVVKALDVSAYCYDGKVFLVGEYDNVQQKKRAEDLAKDVEGVKSVQTYLLPKKKSDSCGTAESASITAKVSGKLLADKDVRSTNIDVKTVQCNVVLLGIVRTGKEIAEAVEEAKSVEGVRSVHSFL
ncbi:MAG TPA: BON domain-containing protein, partial [Syntrophales bacterium]|nr:BON domain-containing protein [Syntrophales bacterium]